MLELKEYEDLIAKCSHCQLCQTTCPVYLEDLLETHLAGARLGLISAVFLEGVLPVTKRFREILARCLLCTNCTQTCPSWVPVDEIIVAARYKLYGGKRRNAVERRLMHKAMSQRGPKGLMEKAGLLARKMGWSTQELPAPDPLPFEDRYQGLIPAEGKRRARVAYYVGCATNAFYPDTAEAVVRVLARNGIEVIIPEGLVCCGLPALVDGDLATAGEMLRTNISSLADLEVEAIVTDCTSCGLVFKAKALKILSQDDPVRPQAEAVAARTWEATDYLNHIGLVSDPSPLPEQWTYHVPCHRGWTLTVTDAPRRLLAEVPQAGLVEMEYPERCCGAGGGFFLEFRELSESIRSHKLEDILKTGTRTILTQCPACRSYLSGPLKDFTVMHPLSFLARAYGN